jgi:hypothetical protein
MALEEWLYLYGLAALVTGCFCAYEILKWWLGKHHEERVRIVLEFDQAEPLSVKLYDGRKEDEIEEAMD